MSTRHTRRDFEEMERRRCKGMKLLAAGHSQSEVARRCGVSRTSAMRWDRTRQAQRGSAWKRRPLGRPRKITQAHLKALRGALEKGAQAHGFLNELWTLPRVAEVLYRLSGVRCHPAHVWKLLGRMNWSAQRPTGRATERDEEAIARWKRYTWPALKKKHSGKHEPSCLSTKAD